MDKAAGGFMDHDLAQGFRLKDVRVAPATGELAGPGGREQVDPKVMGVLLALARRAGELVSRDALLHTLWPGAVVTDDVLSRCVYKLRVHLLEAGGHPTYKAMIETLPKRGYRLACLPAPADGVFEPADARPQGASGKSRIAVAGMAVLLVIAAATWWTLGARRDSAPAPYAALAAAIPPKSIAVLPFADMSAERDQEYFGDGIAEEILNLLAQSPELKVIARTSSFSFKGSTADIETIAARLGVAHVLEGSVRKFGKRVRITAQLVDARDSSHLWSDTYDRELDDLLLVQTEIASAVADVLKAALLDDGAADRRRPQDSKAYEQYLRARFMFNRRAPGDLLAARETYNRATKIDPAFAPAWVGLAATYIVQSAQGQIPAGEGMALGLAAVERALELDPRLPEAHLRAATLHVMKGNLEAAARHARTAEALDPKNPLLLSMRAGGELDKGDHASAIALLEQVVAVDPLSLVHRVNLASMYFGAGRLEDARNAYQVVRELNPAYTARTDARLGQILVLEGRHAEAVELVDAIPESEGRNMVLAMAGPGLGREAEALAALERLLEANSSEAAFCLADLYAYRGDAEESLRWLAESERRLRAELGPVQSPRRWASLAFTSAFLRPLHADPRWTALLDLAGSFDEG
jgi:TolB-like protein/DNA-binding winged helix-turn-helix (wHTH) protein/Flp pilus assembly protein TadD